MTEKTIKGLQEKYDLELKKVVSEIKKSKAKLVLLQFPDGLKPYATLVVDYLEKAINNPIHSSKSQMSETKAEFLIWLGTCFGACDTPLEVEKLKPKVDLIIQFGHNELLPSY